MIAMLNFIELATATVFAVAVAAVFSWVSLRIAFVLMQPATARDLAPRTDLARGTAQLARLRRQSLERARSTGTE